MCREKGIPVRFRQIPAREVGIFDSCFLTGTARKVVPVRFIGETEFKVDTGMLNTISSAFGECVDRYVRRHANLP